MKRILIAILALAVLGFGLAQDATVDMSDRSIGEILNSSEQVSILNLLVEVAGLDEQLRTGGPFTVFAPVDRAWLGLEADAIGQLIRNPEALQDVLLYHVVSGELESGQLFGLLIEDARLRIGDENTPGMEVEDPVDALQEAEDDEPEAPLDARQIGDDATNNLDIEDPVEALLATGVTSAVAFETVQGGMIEVVAARTADTQTDGSGQRIGEGDEFMDVTEPVAALRAEGVDLMVDDANFVRIDIIASNGVIHLIDRILMPEGFQLPN
jgi:uncharacterized surface protein with fasciclin (FAS1) repeats